MKPQVQHERVKGGLLSHGKIRKVSITGATTVKSVPTDRVKTEHNLNSVCT